MAVSAVGFGWMSQWSFTALETRWPRCRWSPAGLGIGLAMAPVNAALLSATEPAVHGLASALLIVARTVGKLVGISALTTIGLRRYFAEQAGLPEPMEVCGQGHSRCTEFSRILQDAGLVQLHTIFLGAAACCVVAGLVALAVFRHADTREVHTSALESGNRVRRGRGHSRSRPRGGPWTLRRRDGLSKDGGKERGPRPPDHVSR